MRKLATKMSVMMSCERKSIPLVATPLVKVGLMPKSIVFGNADGVTLLPKEDALHHEKLNYVIPLTWNSSCKGRIDT